jgi:putative FmdB family regulatory protein
MPIYEYRCHSCGKKFEALQKFSDEPLTVHPECGGGPVDRLLSAPALQFKGSGWYVNDYAKGGSSSSKPGETKNDATTGAKSDAKSGSKTDATSSTSSSASASTTPPAAPTPSK